MLEISKRYALPIHEMEYKRKIREMKREREGNLIMLNTHELWNELHSSQKNIQKYKGVYLNLFASASAAANRHPTENLQREKHCFTFPLYESRVLVFRMNVNVKIRYFIKAKHFYQLTGRAKMQEMFIE